MEAAVVVGDSIAADVVGDVVVAALIVVDAEDVEALTAVDVAVDAEGLPTVEASETSRVRR